MCTDQLLLALAQRDQIVGLSRFAGDEQLSFAASEADGFPHLPAAAEAVIALDPDLVLAGQFTNSAAKNMLRRLGYRVEEVPFVRSLEEAKAAIRLVGDIVDEKGRAEQLIVAIDMAIEERRSEADVSALLVQRRGYMTGTASLTADLLDRLGITLASDGLVSSSGGFASLEALVMAKPDLLVTASLVIEDEDQGAALLRHRALAESFEPAQRMALPERLTLCPGPSLIEAVHHIARERDAFLARRGD